MPPRRSTASGGSVGGTLFLLTYANTANAFIDDGAVVNANGDIDVASHTDTEVYNYTKQGGAGHTFSVEGDVVITTLNNQNLAYIEDTAIVHAGGDVAVHADQNLFGVTITGANSTEAPIGVGISAAVNTFTNDTRAFIGNYNSTAVPLPTGSVTAGGSLYCSGDHNRDVLRHRLRRGGRRRRRGAQCLQQRVVGRRPLRIASPRATPVANTHKSAGVAISGAAIVNDLHQDSTKAYISDGVAVETPETLTVKATSNLLLMSAAGVLAASSDKKTTSNIALAGGFAYDNLQKDSSGLQRDVEAYVQGSTIHAADTVVDAEQSAHIWTFAAGAAGSRPDGDKSVAIFGSATLNLIDMYTHAGLLDNTILKASSNIVPSTVAITSNSVLQLISAAGGIAVAGEAGVGAAVDVGIAHVASIADVGPAADIEPTGNVTVVAHGSENIISVGVSLALGTKDYGISGAGVESEHDHRRRGVHRAGRDREDGGKHPARRLR